jgi:hypothetical protein
LIPPFEIDIYLPERKIAIEYCGLYWHSEESGKDKNYHLNKLNHCNELGIRLITIFEDEWLYKQDIVIDKLLHIISSRTTPRVYARNCEIVNVTKKQRDKFMERHHIQGDGPGSITYGLRYNDQLVAVMTLIKKANHVWILNRYATSIGVTGGFSKLVNHFACNNQWDTIVSFADRRWSEGNVYYKNGFVLDNTLAPDYQYIIGSNRVHKFNFRHSTMAKKLKKYDPAISESANMTNNNIKKIWNCGLLRFVKYNNG